jgi:hypothetical protein
MAAEGLIARAETAAQEATIPVWARKRSAVAKRLPLRKKLRVLSLEAGKILTKRYRVGIPTLEHSMQHEFPQSQRA